MKNFKTALAVLAVMIGMTAAFAFKSPAAKPTNPYWQYVSGSVDNPASYSLLPGLPSCSGSTHICAIQAPAQAAPHTNEPQINTDLQGRIDDMDTSDHDVFLQGN